MSTPRSRPPQYRANTGYRPVQKRDSYEKPNGFLSFILYLFTTISILVFIGLLVLHTAGVGNIIRNTDILHYLEDFAVEGHDYYIVDQINNMPFSNSEVTLVDIEDFIKTEAVTDSINSIIENYAQAFAMGNLEHHVTVAEVAGIAHNLNEEISEFFGHDMTDEDIEQLAERLDDLLDFNSMTIDGLMEDFDVDMSVPLMLLSPALRWLVGTLCVILLTASFAIRLSSLPHAFCAVGIPITVAGLISFFIGMYFDAATHTPGSTFERFEQFLEEPITQIMQYGFMFAAVGILTIIIAKMFSYAGKRG